MALRNRNQNYESQQPKNYAFSSPTLINVEENVELIRPEYRSAPNLYENNKTNDSAYMASLNAFFQSLLNNISCFWTLLNTNFTPQKSPQANNSNAPTLTVYQEEKFAEFKKFVSKPYDSENEYHEGELARYWRIVSNGEELTSRKSAQWKKLGFQGIDPASDFRGAGIFGLQNLLYFALKYPQKFRSNFRGDKQIEPQETYPFSIASLNISMMLFEYIGWGNILKAQKKDAIAKRNLIMLLFKKDRPFDDLIKFENGNDLRNDMQIDSEDEDDMDDLIPAELNWSDKKKKDNINEIGDKKIEFGDHHSRNEIYFGDDQVKDEYNDALNQSLNIFSEIYCIAFDILENEWYSRANVSYMDFPAVLDATSDKVGQLLKRFNSIADVYDHTRDWD